MFYIYCLTDWFGSLFSGHGGWGYPFLNPWIDAQLSAVNMRHGLSLDQHAIASTDRGTKKKHNALYIAGLLQQAQ